MLVFIFLIALVHSMMNLAAARDGFLIVVNARNQGARITRVSLQAIYLRPGTRWRDGTLIEAIDQSTRREVRAAFSHRILGMSVGEAQMHWLNLVKSGKGTPPRTKDDDASVLAFVGGTPGAIGYVSADVAVDAAVKTLEVVE